MSGHLQLAHLTVEGGEPYSYKPVYSCEPDCRTIVKEVICVNRTSVNPLLVNLGVMKPPTSPDLGLFTIPFFFERVPAISDTNPWLLVRSYELVMAPGDLLVGTWTFPPGSGRLKLIISGYVEDGIDP